MQYFLGFNVYIEQSPTGGWHGYAINKEIRLNDIVSPTLGALQQALELSVLKHLCRSDMGASYIVKGDKIVYVNLPGKSFKSLPEVNCGHDGAVLADGIFDNKKAQYRLSIKSFRYYSLIKIIGIYIEPNLLSVKG